MAHKGQKHCPKCERKLIGEVKVSSAQVGSFNFVVVEETSDRNWIECDACSKLLCKNCCALPDSGYCDWCFYKMKIAPALA